LEKCELIPEKPCGVFFVAIDIVSDYVGWEATRNLRSQLPKEYMGLQFRAVSIDRLSTVLLRGIDVEPTNSVIWVNHLDKAMEYGGWPKLVMALDYRLLKWTCVELDANASEAELTSVRRDYPTVLKDGSKLFCSRLKADAPQLNTPYEFDSARWIPGDPWEALKGVFVFYRPKDLAEMENVRRQIIQKFPLKVDRL
jgi:hypothetical protein